MLFLDEATLYTQPSVASAWHKRGRIQPSVRLEAGPNRGVRALAFVSLDGTTISGTYPKVTAKRLSEAYRLAGQAYPKAKEVTIALVNWPVHYHERALRALEEDPRLRLLWLPTYAPWLNPVEKLWKWLRQRLAHNHPWAGDRDELERQAKLELERIRNQAEELLRYVGLNRQ